MSAYTVLRDIRRETLQFHAPNLLSDVHITHPYPFSQDAQACVPGATTDGSISFRFRISMNSAPVMVSFS